MKNKRMTDDQREKWLKIMCNDIMSSEESGNEDEMIIHPLPWRSKYVNIMFQRIDHSLIAHDSHLNPVE